MYFVCGVHGVGKTLFANKVSKKMSLNYYSAGKLIKSKANGVISNYKKVNQIFYNQLLLLEAINEIKEPQYVLDGHLCLINEDNQIERIPFEVFEKINIDIIYIIVDKPLRIKNRLQNRDSQKWNVNFIASFQQEEIMYARELAGKLNIPLKIIYDDKEIEKFSDFEKENIILPIKPVFAGKIIDGKKIYEYRKKLCQKSISKIYIYATAPTKKIIGEAEVVQKLKMDKEELWRQTQLHAGISKEFFDNYFKNQKCACAYQIGKTKRYNKPITLESLGIEHVPQSFIYCGKLEIE